MDAAGLLMGTDCFQGSSGTFEYQATCHRHLRSGTGGVDVAIAEDRVILIKLKPIKNIITEFHVAHTAGSPLLLTCAWGEELR